MSSYPYESYLKHNTVATYNSYHSATHKFVKSDINAVQKLKVGPVSFLVMVV